MWTRRILQLLPLLLLLLPLQLVARCRGAPQQVEALQQIPQLSYEQVTLIAGNATARCNLMPQLCGWQLHLYEGHAFQVQLPGNRGAEAWQTASTTSVPLMETKPPQQLLFAVPGINNAQGLLIYAEVEPLSKPKLKSKSKSKSRKRKRLLVKSS